MFECGRCGEELILWDVAVEPRVRTRIRRAFTVRSCGAHMAQAAAAVAFSTEVGACTDPRMSAQCRARAAVEPPATQTGEKQRITEIEAKSIPYWYPTTLSRNRLGDVAQCTSRSRHHRCKQVLHTTAIFGRWRDFGQEAGRCQMTDCVTHLQIRYSLAYYTGMLEAQPAIDLARAGDLISGTLYVASLRVRERLGCCLSRTSDELFPLWLMDCNSPAIVRFRIRNRCCDQS